MSEPLYREAPRDTHIHHGQWDCDVGDCEATTKWVVPVEPDSFIARIQDAIVSMTRTAQALTLAANSETAPTLHITEHLLTGIHAGLWRAIADGAGIGGDKATPPNLISRG